MADVQRQFQYFADPRGDAEQDAKEEVAGQRAEVVVDEVGKAGAGGGGQQAAQQGVYPQAFAQAQVLGAVVVVAGDDAGAKQPDGGYGGVEERGGQGERRHLVFGAVVVEQRCAGFACPDEAERGGGEHGEAEVAEDGDAL